MLVCIYPFWTAGPVFVLYEFLDLLTMNLMEEEEFLEATQIVKECN